MTATTDPLEGLRAMAAPSRFPGSGELALDGLEAAVRVRRDAWGVPYVEAGTLADLWFAQGVVTAGERLFQLDLALRAATGRLSEVVGSRALDDDRFVRTVGFHLAGPRIAERWDATSVAMHERFRAGVQAWIDAMPALPIEYTMLDLTPELPDEVGDWAAAFVYLSWRLSGNALQELMRSWIAERAGPAAVARLMPSTPARTLASTGAGATAVPIAGGPHGRIVDAMRTDGGRGSNAWVVAPSRTTTGGSILANDPHLDALQPGVWLELHLSAPGYRARGVALPWSPGIVLGTTAHHAWGATNVSGDTQDVVVERLLGDTAVRRGDGRAPVQVRTERIAVRGEEPAELTVRSTSNGPILGSFPVGDGEVEHVDLAGGDTALALAWTGLEHAIEPSLALLAAAATSFDTFREAVAGVTCPGQNFVYADVDGTIGYVCTGVYPIRRDGDGTVPVADPGADHVWSGTIDPADLPWSVDPERGYVVTANDRPHGPDYPHLIGRDFHPPHRAGRIAAVLEAGGRHDVVSMATLQTDTVSTTAVAIVDACRTLEPTTADQRLALDLLDAWDGDIAADSGAALVFQTWSGALARRRLVPALGEELFGRYQADREVWHTLVLPTVVADPAAADDVLAAFDDAVAELRSRVGPDPSTWRWGAVHRLRLAHPLAAIPGLEELFTAVDAEVGGDETTVSQTAFDSREGFGVTVLSSWRAVYDLADLDRSVGVLPAGVSGNPASPHWRDQADLWLSGDTHPLPFSEAAVDEATGEPLLLRPARAR